MRDPPSEVIEKSPDRLGAPPQLEDYERCRAGFSWEKERSEPAGLPAGEGLNLAYEAVDRRAAGAEGGRLALRWLGKDGRSRTFTYAQLKALTDRFAAALAGLGVGPGERVFVLSGRVPEHAVAALGTLKRRAVFCPLFPGFGPEPVRARLKLGRAAVLVATEELYEGTARALRGDLPGLRHVVLIGEGGAPTNVPGTLDWGRLIAAAPPAYEIGPTDPEDPALLHFTGGTTGAPKGVLHVHASALVHRATGRLALDLRPGDVYWCTAEPGWMTGTAYGLLAPLLNGAATILDEAGFDAERWYEILETQKVSVWYTSPAGVRLLMKLGAAVARRRAFPALRFMACSGEPLDAETVRWGLEAFGLPFHDNWWQTETGGIMIANFAAMGVRPGSMGRPLPGIEAAVVRRAGPDAVEAIAEPGVQGELALRPGFPSLFRDDRNDPRRREDRFAGGWYLTGDLARRDADGYFWFAGRTDDAIKNAGGTIGPCEIERALLEHPAVAEAAVIGKPDPLAGETIAAFVRLEAGFEPSAGLRRELLAFGRSRLGAVAPEELEFRGLLPRTRSGKIMRRLLRAEALGLPEGDASALDRPP